MRKIDYIEPVSLKSLALRSIPKYLKGKLDYNHSLLIENFEKALAKYLKVKYCLCVNAGTTGLILALKALDIDEEVIVPSYTFCGTVHPLTWNGIRPKFVDIDPRTFNIDLNQVKESITRKTKAIVAVHTYGNPCDIESLESLARKHKLKLIFDSASAFGCKYKGRKLGGFGDAEVFSLQATKNFNVLEGGFISFNRDDLYKKLIFLRRQGNQGDGNCIYVGLNARMHPLAAVLGLAALKDVDKNIKKRQELGSYFYSLLSTIKGIELQVIEEGIEFNYQYMPILVKEEFGLSRNGLIKALSDKGIVTRKYFHPPVHQYSCYRHIKNSLPLKTSEYVADHIICLPFYLSMSYRNIEHICKILKNIQKTVSFCKNKDKSASC